MFFGFFLEIDKVIFKFIWNFKRPNIANTTLKKKNKVGGLTLPDFKTYCKATGIETVVLVLKIHKHQWNVIENPEIDTCT